MKKLIVALAFLAVVTAVKKSYEGYQVFRIVPTDEKDLQFLRSLDNYTESELSLWQNPTSTSIDLMVGPNKTEEFDSLIKSVGVNHTIIIRDVQTVIDRRNSPDSRADGDGSSFDWKHYPTLDEINAYLKYMAEKYPKVVQLVSAGKSFEGRKIQGVKISFNENNPRIFLEGGIYGTHWLPSATLTYVINELLTSKNTEVRELARTNNWYIFPVVNPDGYVYSQTIDSDWDENRKPSAGCMGTMLDNNWGYHWLKNDAGDCTGFPGEKAFSEPETEKLSELITSISKNMYAYIAFHDRDNAILYPYGYTSDKLENYKQMNAIGLKAAAAMAKRYNTKFVVSNANEYLGETFGSSVDWVKGKFRMPLTYIYGLSHWRVNALLAKDIIIPVGQEVVDSLVGLFKAAAKYGIPPRQNVTTTSPAPTTPSTTSPKPTTPSTTSPAPTTPSTSSAPTTPPPTKSPEPTTPPTKRPKNKLHKKIEMFISMFKRKCG